MISNSQTTLLDSYIRTVIRLSLVCRYPVISEGEEEEHYGHHLLPLLLGDMCIWCLGRIREHNLTDNLILQFRAVLKDTRIAA